MNGLWSELRRRNVFRVAIAYALVAWILLQIADVLFPALSLPDWTVRLVAGLLLLGFPLALFLAWAFELTPEGLKREREVDRKASITRQTGRRIDRFVIAVLAVALALFALDRFVWHPAASPQLDRSIAVLPFVNMSDDKANEYFSDGISEELLNLLAKIPELRVIGRTSSFQFKGQNEDLRSIGDKLGVSNILEGSVRKSGNKVRITAQLVSADDGAHLWSEAYDRDLGDVFSIQSEIATAVVDALRPELLGTPIATRETSTAAYDTYLKGLFLYRKLGQGDLQRAIEFFDEALRLDPGLADAWEKRGAALMNQTLGGTLPLEEGMRQVQVALDRAVKLDPDSAESHYQHGFMQLAFEWNWADAETSLQKALSIEPNHSGALSGLALLRLAQDRFDEAVELSSRSLEADPLRIASHHNHGFIHYKGGHPQEAVQIFRDTLRLSPQMVRGNFRLALALLGSGDAAAALTEAQQERGEQWRLAGLAIVHWSLGNVAEADAALAELEARFADDAPYMIANAYAQRGDADAAFSWYDRGFEKRDPLMPWIRDDPLLDGIRDDPRFGALLDRLRLPR